MSRRIVAVLTALALLTAGLSACGSSTGGSGSTSGGLSDALDSVSAGPAGQAWFEYGDLATLRRIGALNPAGLQTHAKVIETRWNAVVGVGESAYSSSAAQFPETLGLNPFAATRAVTIGQPPNLATRLDGSFDVATINSKLAGYGAKPRTFGSTAGLSFGPDNHVDVNSPLTTKLGLVNQLDQVVVAKDRFASSSNAASLQQVLGGGSSLLHAPHYQDMANCLGDVVAAEIYAPKNDKRTVLVGVGVRTPKDAGAGGIEVLCSVPASGQQGAVHAAYAKNLALSATNPVANEPNSQRMTEAKVIDAGGLVQAVLTLRPATPVGLLFLGVEQDLPSYWDGSCTLMGRVASPAHC